MAKTIRQTDDPSWNDCPAGEVGGLVDRLQRRHRSEQRRQLAAGIACLAVVLMAGVYAIPRLGLSNVTPTNVVCADVHRLADQYVAGQLDNDMAARINVHLKRCAPCRELVEKLRSSQHAAEPNVQTDLVAISLGSL